MPEWKVTAAPVPRLGHADLPLRSLRLSLSGVIYIPPATRARDAHAALHVLPVRCTVSAL